LKINLLDTDERRLTAFLYISATISALFQKTREEVIMRKSTNMVCILGLIIFSMLTGCAGSPFKSDKMAAPVPESLTVIQQIDSFKTQVACSQALEVINNNSYEQEFFEKVFTKIIDQCRNSTSPDNADLIWEHFIVPLNQSGKVPPDLAKDLWNCYFSKQFVSLPDKTPVSQNCYDLAHIKKNMEKEYQLKKAGFEICQQGSPDTHFLNAMYVYNTMWAACNGTDN